MKKNCVLVFLALTLAIFATPSFAVMKFLQVAHTSGDIPSATNVGTTYSSTYTITNIATVPVSIVLSDFSYQPLNIGFSVPATSNTCLGRGLPQGGSCSFQMVYTPTVTGNFTLGVNVTYLGDQHPNYVTVNTTSSTSGEITSGAVTTKLPASTTTGTGYPVLFTFTNVGNVTVTANSVTLTGATANLSNVSNNCTTVIQPNGTCTVSGTFTPSEGTSSIGVTYVYNNNSQSVQLSTTTTATTPTASVTGTITKSIPSPTSESSTYPFRITFTNAGNLDVTQTGSFSVSGTGASHVTGLTSSASCASLKPTDTCTVTGNFNSPASTGSFDVQLSPYTFTSSAGSGSASVPDMSTTVTSGTCGVSGLTILGLPSTTYPYADNVVKFEFTNNCPSTAAIISSATIGGGSGAATTTTDSSTNTCSGTLTGGSTCVMYASITPGTTLGSLPTPITATLTYTGPAGSPATASTTTTIATNTTTQRTLTVINQCPFPVWMSFSGGAIPNSPASCSTAVPTSTYAQTSICNTPNPMKTGCVANPGICGNTGTCDTSAPNGGECFYGCPDSSICDAAANGNNGQCYFTAQPNPDPCLNYNTTSSCNTSASGGAGLCFFNNPALTGHANGELQIPSASANVNGGVPDTINFTLPLTAAPSGNTIYDGAIIARRGCTGNGSTLFCKINNCGGTVTPTVGSTGSDGMCAPGENGSNSPGISYDQVEFGLTTTGAEPLYDQTFVNGVNVPIEMKGRGPITTSIYDCQAAGGIIQPSTGSSSTQLGMCTYNFITPTTAPDGTTPDPSNYAFVIPPATSPQTCVTSSTCSGNDVCGLAYVDQGGNIGYQLQKYCGTLAGYVSVNEAICSQPPANSATNPTLAALQLQYKCFQTIGSGTATGAQLFGGILPSCYSAGSNSNCTGCADWWKFTSTVTGTNIVVPTTVTQCPISNQNWGSASASPPVTGIVQPQIQWMKSACPTAYSYQFDDPSSNFICEVNTGSQNTTNYQVTFCPGGATIQNPIP